MKTLKFIFASLFSNQTIIDEEKKQPWYLALLLAIISCIIVIIPNIVSTLSVNGSDAIVATANSELDYALNVFAEDYLKDSKLSLKINNGEMTVTGYSAPIEIKYNDDIVLVVSYTELDSDVQKLITKINTSYLVDGTTDSSYVYSFLVFSKTSVYLSTYNKGSIAKFTNNNGDITINEAPAYTSYISGSFKEIESKYQNLNTFFPSNVSKSEAYKVNIENFTNFFDQAYAPVRNQYVLSTSLVYSGINVSIIALMSLTLFLMSRGKSSIRKYNYLESLKVSGFASLSPAIVGIILGGLIPSFQSMAFVLCFGMRITWLASKATNPSPDSQSEPVRK